MAIGTPTSLGTNVNTASGAVTLTTGATAPSNSLILIVVAGVTNAATPGQSTITGGSLTWTKHKETTAGPNSGFCWTIACWSAPAAGGLASSTVLSTSWDQTVIDGLISGAYCTGLDLTGTRTDGTDGRSRTTLTTSWDTQATTAPTTTATDTLIYGGAFIDTQTTSTPSGCTELFDFQETSNQQTQTVAYNILAATGAVRLQGTWGAASGLADVSAVVAYKAAAGGAAAPIPDVVMAPFIPS